MINRIITKKKPEASTALSFPIAQKSLILVGYLSGRRSSLLPWGILAVFRLGLVPVL